MMPIFDGVAISTDGVKWYEVHPLRATAGGLTSSWKEYVVDLDTALKPFGIPYNSAFRLRFCRTPGTSSTGAIAIDDIAVISEGALSPLRLELPEQIAEGATAHGRVLLPFIAPREVRVKLRSNAPSRLSVPTEIVIPTGLGSGDFIITALENGIVDGGRKVSVLATADYIPTGGMGIEVTDRDESVFSFTVPITTVTEGATPIPAVISVSRVVSAPLTFTATSSDPTAISVPPTITLEPGTNTVELQIVGVNDRKIDGSWTATITVSRNGRSITSPTITALDNETLNLRFSSTAVNSVTEIGESIGAVSDTFLLPGTVTTPTTVTFTSSNPARLAVPAPITIAAGSTSANVVFTVLNDFVPALPELITVTASAPGFNAVTRSFRLMDDDPHHFTISPIASPQVRNAPIPVTITARDANGDALKFLSGLPNATAISSSGGVIPNLIPEFSEGTWHGTVRIPTSSAGVVLQVLGPGGAAGSSNPFDVSIGDISAFAWDPIAVVTAPGANLPVGIRAIDVGGTQIPVDQPVAIRAMVPVPSIGVEEQTHSVMPVVQPGSFAARREILYLASELGQAKTLCGLRLHQDYNVSPHELPNFTIRLKSTTRTSVDFADGWDTDGWKVVHRSNVPVSKAGWVTFHFDSPYYFDGSSNLMVDLSSTSPVAFTSSAEFSSGSGDQNRTLFGFSSDPNTNPLVWAGNANLKNINSGLPRTRFLELEETAPEFPAAQLAAGRWTGQIAFPGAMERVFLEASDASGRSGFSNGFAVQPPLMKAPTTLPFSDGFESENLSENWVVSKVQSGNARVIATEAPHGGQRHVVLDGWSGSRTELTVTLDLRGYSGVTLSFWVKRFPGGFDEGPPSSPFLEGADFDGVAISANGSQWYEIQSLRGMTPGVWTPFTVNLDAAIAARGLQYTSAFQIRFNQRTLDVAPRDGIALDDVLVTGNPIGRVRVSLPNSVQENAGTVAGSVLLPGVASSPFTVSLNSSSPLIFSVPPSVVVAAGQSSAEFTATVTNNADLNGAVPVLVQATAPGLITSLSVVEVMDDESASLELTLPATLNENAENAEALLVISPAPTAGTMVKFTSSLPQHVQLPSSVIVPSGQSQLSVPIVLIRDYLATGTRSVNVTAEVSGWATASATSELIDSEASSLFLGSGTVNEGGSSSLSVYTGQYPPGADIVVSLSSSDPSRLSVPSTVIIQGGTYSATYTATAADNGASEGVVPVVVTASLNGFGSRTAVIKVNDNDVHHFTFEPIGAKARGESFPITINACDINGDAIPAFTGTVNLAATGDAGAVTLSRSATSQFSAGKWTGNLSVETFSQNVRLTATLNPDITGISEPFDVGMGAIGRFEWGNIPAGQVTGVPFAAQIRAFDGFGNEIPDYRGYVRLGSRPVERSVGTGTNIADFPLNAQVYDHRTQVLYTDGEIGEAGLLASLSLDLVAVPGGTLNNWTIRMKHTNLTVQNSSSFDTSGWRTVYQKNETDWQSGWRTFVFDRPFVFDGTSNLLIDFSFNNSAAHSLGRVRAFAPLPQTTRTVYAGTNSSLVDPLGWTGTTFGSTPTSSIVPQLKFNRGGSLVGVSPGVIFMDGSSWSLNISLQGQAASAAIVASDLSGDTIGISNEFSLLAAPDADGDHLPDSWEIAHGLNATDGDGEQGSNGDLDGDEIPNLLEYAFGLDPMNSDVDGVPSVGWGESAGRTYLEFSYRRRIGITGLQYTVETSGDLQQSWSSDSANYEQVGPPVGIGDGLTEIVTVRLLPAIGTPGAEQRFVRLRVLAP